MALLKQKARALAEREGCDTILCDGAPGIACPVISSLSGAHLAVLVTEPTPSGSHAPGVVDGVLGSEPAQGRDQMHRPGHIGRPHLAIRMQVHRAVHRKLSVA